MSSQWIYQPSEIFASSPVVPVMVIEKLEQAVPLAKALVAGGINILEVTLRTDCALDAIRAIRDAVPEALVGAGSVQNAEHLQQVIDAGAQFAISPGTTPALLAAAKEAPICLIPGVSSASEAMVALELGYDHLKFFPAEASGGAKAIKAIGGPLPQLVFCPTGGVGPDNYRDYLALSNIRCVGGSWVAPNEAIEQGDWGRITELSRQALAI